MYFANTFIEDEIRHPVETEYKDVCRSHYPTQCAFDPLLRDRSNFSLLHNLHQCLHSAQVDPEEELKKMMMANDESPNTPPDGSKCQNRAIGRNTLGLDTASFLGLEDPAINLRIRSGRGSTEPVPEAGALSADRMRVRADAGALLLVHRTRQTSRPSLPCDLYRLTSSRIRVKVQCRFRFVPQVLPSIVS